MGGRLLLRVLVGVSLLTFGFQSPVHAESNASSPTVTKGQMEFEYELVDRFDDDGSKAGAEHEFEMTYGLTDRIRPQIELEFEDETGASAKVEALAFGVQYQMTKKDEAWLESALRLNYDFCPDDANELRGRLILQKHYGPFRQRVTLRADQELGDEAIAGGLEWRVLVGSRYKLSDAYELGLEYDGTLGRIRDFDNYGVQEHYVGPAFYGKLMDGIEYEFGYAFGLSKAAADGALRFGVEYSINL